MAVGADLLHISSLSLLEKDQICHISGKNADDDFGQHKLQNIASAAGIRQQKNDRLI